MERVPPYDTYGTPLPAPAPSPMEPMHHVPMSPPRSALFGFRPLRPATKKRPAKAREKRSKAKKGGAKARRRR